MLRGLLRLLVFALVFWFVYRVITGALRYLAHDSEKKERSADRMPPEPKEDDQRDYHDVKDARFTDLPDDSSKPS